MAAAMTSSLMSKCSCFTYNGASDSKAMAFPRISFSSSHTSTCEGLRVRHTADPRETKAKAASTRRPHTVVPCRAGMNLVFVGAEVAPWSKTGGLGDVLGGLPPAMAANGHRVMTVAPRYDQYADGWDTSTQAKVIVGDKMETVRFFHCYKRGVDRVFVDHPLFLEQVRGKTGGRIYGPNAGTDYPNNQMRFSLLCQAALEAPRILNLNNNENYSGPYGEDIVFIANDWHTALLPCYLKSMYQKRGMYKNAKVAFCIHNIAYQGRFAFKDFESLNLPNEFIPSFDFMDGFDKPCIGRKINWMKAGILQSEKVATVSPYYAHEVVSGIDTGVELDDILRKKTISGIVNGMDVSEWNPELDKHIDLNYDASSVMPAKALNKEALQAQVGLPIDKGVPLLAFIGRLEEQKGSDILAAAIPQFINEDVQVILLGTGKERLEQELENLELKYPNKFKTHLKFNVPVAHALMAGADMIVIPSRFEPCGLIQLQAMQYGTPAICSSTGGLVDTIKEGFTGFHMGRLSVECKTVEDADVQKIVRTVKRALKVYGTPAFAKMVQNCMNQDLSWRGPAKKWEEFLLDLGVAGSEPGIEGEEVDPLAVENIATP